MKIFSGAGHVGRYISLANPDRLSALACHIPAFFVYSLLALFALCFYTDRTVFYMLFIVLGIYCFGWASYMAFCACLGVMEMLRSCARNWSEELKDFFKKNPKSESGLLHFVCLPNYAEDEEMLGQSIQVCADTSLAKKHMVIVLAMEAREGDEGQRKAKK